MMRKTRRRLQWVAAILIVAALLIVGRQIEADTYLKAIQKWVWSLGPWGPAVYVLLFVIAMLFLLPGTPFTVIAALVFGTLWGYVTMLVATTLAASSGFLIARYLARGIVERRLAGAESFRKLREITERNHWIAIPFVRLMPVFPFAVNNYALGLTRLSFWRFFFWSEVVFIPMNAVLVVGSGAIYRAMVRGEVSWLLIVITAGAGMLVLLLGMLGKRVFGQPREAE